MRKVITQKTSRFLPGNFVNSYTSVGGLSLEPCFNSAPYIWTNFFWSINSWLMNSSKRLLYLGMSLRAFSWKVFISLEKIKHLLTSVSGHLIFRFRHFYAKNYVLHTWRIMCIMLDCSLSYGLRIMNKATFFKVFNLDMGFSWMLGVS